MLKAEDVARYFLSIQGTEGTVTPISNLKIQKLCYYAQGFALAILDRPLFFEDIEAWEHGPVIEPLWKQFRQYAGDPIPSPTGGIDLKLYDPEIQVLLEGVYREYGRFSAWKLRNMTHTEAPWMNTASHCAMTHAALRKYFKGLVDAQRLPAAREPSNAALASQMADDPVFRKLTEQGLADMAEDRYSTRQEVEDRLADV